MRFYSAHSSFFFSGFSRKCAAVPFYKSIHNDPSRHYSRFIRKFQRIFEIARTLFRRIGEIPPRWPSGRRRDGHSNIA